jgi:diguanylate cyclase (GGDEF)-like protein
MKQAVKIYILLVVSIIGAIIYLFITTNQIQEKLNSNVEKLLIQQAASAAKNIAIELQKQINDNPYEELKKNPQLRKHLEDELSILVSDFSKYIFVLYRDKSNNFRYLLDGSPDKGFFNQRLNVDKKYWNRVYETKQPVIIKQSQLESIWVTYLQPVLFDGKVKAVIAIDFSTKLPENIYHATAPLKNIFTYIFFSIIILLFILIYQILLSFKSKKESITDELTQTYNRNFLRDFIQKANIAQYQIMMLDIDHFKQVNDNYGHKAGDLILTKTAKIIAAEIREDDYLIRFGGEEFLLFIKKGKNTPELAYNIAQRIRKTIEKTDFIFEDKQIKITVSIGICQQPEHFKSISQAIKHADAMLYRAKREGRNKVVSSKTDINASLTKTDKKSINEVKEALEEQRIICYYQPIFDTQKQSIVKYEALARMIEKDGSIVLPFHFLETIAHTTVYNDFTKRIIELVFEQIKEKKATISINLNFSDLLETTIFTTILQELQAHKELTKWLVIELLEYEVVKQDSLIQERLSQIQSFGVQIALDDFGSGYANYTVFKSLPINILKIDGSLIKDIDSSSLSYKITHSIVMLAKELGITTVAEFVHSAEVYKIVQELDVDYSQGFYLAKPSAKI